MVPVGALEQGEYQASYRVQRSTVSDLSLGFQDKNRERERFRLSLVWSGLRPTERYVSKAASAARQYQ